MFEFSHGNVEGRLNMFKSKVEGFEFLTVKI
jgi:hypothetical protein